jgi:hypothetical protein
MKDRKGDGICCKKKTGKGFIEIFAIVNGQQIWVAGAWGNSGK